MPSRLTSILGVLRGSKAFSRSSSATRKEIQQDVPQDTIVLDTGTLRPKTPRLCLSGLELLPSELFDQICGYLSLREIVEVALCSITLHYTTLPYAFPSLMLDMRNSAGLTTSIEYWSLFLERRKAYNLVTHVDIQCRRWLDDHKSLETSFRAQETNDKSTSVISNEKLPLHLQDYAKVQDLLVKLTRLKSINLYVTDIAPVILLDYVQQHHPRCSLGVYHLAITAKSLAELAILRPLDCTNLKSIEVTFNRTQSMRDDQELLLQTTKCAIANASHLESLEIRLLESWGLTGQWAGFILADLLEHTATDRTPANLKSLKIQQEQRRSNDYSQPSLLTKSLGDGIDISCMRSLSLNGFLAPDLDWLSHWCQFPSLKELEIRAILEYESPEFWHNCTLGVKVFLTSLPPLQRLRLLRIGTDADLIDILGHHKLSIQELTAFFHIEPRYGAEHNHMSITVIKHLASSCPQLRKLEAEVKRTCSDPIEKAIYRSFSSFTKLQILILHMQCFTIGPIGRSDRGRENIINSVVDKSLAKSIWNFVTTGEYGKKTMLAEMQLHPQCQSECHPHDLNEGALARGSPPSYRWLASLCRSYEVIRTIEQNWTAGIDIRQIPPVDAYIRGWTASGKQPTSGFDEKERELIGKEWSVAVGSAGWEDKCKSLAFEEEAEDGFE